MTNSIFFSSGGGGGAGSGIALKSEFDSSTNMSNPGSGDFRLNNATIGSATKIAISHTTSSGADAGDLITNLDVGDYIYIQQIGSESKYLLAEITDRSSSGTWSELDINVSDSGSIFDATSECGLDFNYVNGDVTGPNSSTDNAIARYNGTTGNVIQNSGVIIDNSDNVSGVNNQAIDGYHELSEISEPSDPGANDLRVFAENDNGFGVLNVKDSTGLKVRLGRDQYILVANNTGSPLTVGQVVYYNGNTTGDIPDVDLAQANDPATMPAIGVVEEAIANGAIGRVATGGVIDNVNTAAFSAGDEIYVSSSSAGDLTTTPPTHPNLQQRIAIIKTSNASTGSALINIGLNPDGDSFGTRNNNFFIGDDTSGSKSIDFKNGNTGGLNWNPTDTRTVNIPDISTTLGEDDVKQLIKGDNNSFDNTIGDWAAYADAAGSEPVDGTGGSPTVTITRSTSSPLVGAGMGVITKDAADRQGEGVSLSSIAVPAGYQGQPLLVRLICEGSANYADGDCVLFAYDQTNSELIGAGPLVNNDNGELPQDKTIVDALVYPKSDTASIRLIIHVATTNASAWTLNIDEIEMNWVPFLKLPSFGLSKSYTPTFSGLGTVSGVGFTYQEVGSKAIIEGQFTTGTTAASTASVSFPNNWTARNINFDSNSAKQIGVWYRDTTINPAEKSGPILTFADDPNFYFGSDRDDSAVTPFTAQDGNFVFASSQDVSVKLIVDLNELGASSIDALAINSGLAKGNYGLSGNQTISSTSPTLVEFNTAVTSDRGAPVGGVFDTVNHRLVATRSTWFLINVSIESDNISAGSARIARLRKNGTDQIDLSGRQSGDAGYVFNKIATIIYLESGEYLDVTMQSTDSSYTVIAGDGTTFGFMEVPFSQTALVSGTIKLGEETWTDDQANATTTVAVYKSGPLVKLKGITEFTGAATTELNITIPSIYQPSASNNVRPLGTFRPKVGDATCNDGGAPYNGSVNFTSASNLRIYVNNTGSLANLTSTNPFTWTSGDSITWDAEWEVDGW